MVNRAIQINVVDYNEHWPELFKIEAKKIKAILTDELIELHHIGSTSVPGLKAKPIIDMIPVVKNVEAIDQYNNEMAQIGYEALGEFGIKGRRYFRKGGSNRTHHVHIFQYDQVDDINRHLAVRDYLRSHEEKAREYGALKAQLAVKNPTDIEKYSEGKHEFVQELERLALTWKNK